MAVSITDLRTEWDKADSTTGWSQSATLTVTTSDPDPVDPSGCLGQTVSATSEWAQHDGGSGVDYSNDLVYVWMLPGGVMDTLSAGGVGILLGDAGGVNTAMYHVGGSDVAGFRHNEGPVTWQCFLLDTSNLPAANTTIVGPPDISNIRYIGGYFTTTAKAKGNVNNCYYDVIFVGNDGLRIEGGTTGDRGNFDEIAIDDRSETSGKAYGICRELGAGLFGLQGGLTFGDDGTSDSYFEEKNTTIIFEDRSIGTDKYYIKVEGNSTGTNLWTLGTESGTNEGVDGVNLICPTGVGASFDASNNNIDTMGIYGSLISGFDQGMIFAANTSYEVYSTSFVDCDIVDCDIIQFKNNTIQASANATGGLLLPSNTDNLSTISYIQGTTGHAIYVNPTGAGPFEYDLTAFTYEGFASSNGTSGDECIYVDPVTASADITFNIVGGDTPSIREDAGYTGTVTINQNITLGFSGLQTESEVRIYDLASITPYESLAGIESSNGQVDALTIVDGGSSYGVSDVLTVTGGTGTAATITVDAVSSGVITDASVTTVGEYSANPTNPVSVTGGAGSGATFNLNITGEFEFTVATGTVLNIVVFHQDYKEIRFAGYTVPAADTNIPLTQTIDRVYSNP